MLEQYPSLIIKRGFGQSTQSGGYFNSPGGFDASQSTQKQDKPKNFMPCTIAQIKMSEQVDDYFRIGDVNIHQVTVIGLVRRIEVQATCVLYELDDMTAPTMEIRQWSDTTNGVYHVVGGFGQSTQSGGYFNSPGGFDASQSTQKQDKPKNFMPCTIAQIKMSEQVDDYFRIGDVNIHQVTVIGLVRRIEVQATCVLYELDDMTAPTMEIRQWSDTTDEGETTTMMHKENTYVRVAGNVRVFNNKRILSVFKILPILDLNEISLHMLEVIHSHMLHTKAAANMSSGFGQSTSMMVTPMKGGGGASFNGGGNNGLTGVQNQVHQLINAHVGDQTGISITTLCSRLKGVSKDAIKNALEFLSNEGHIYSTIDDDHFKSTDG
ncbi:replication protein A 32 kDa subunit-like [Anneissia japonica]|uniref:replication protein A 32 kDa subunit-like n=1 Tax=Anneissia japonica TaxID=1529436 RepID=UPI001425B16A|nr:replication protein A 32 kDa subunit-like [Anneissia japonica]